MSLKVKYGQWVDDVLVCSDGTLMTVKDDGKLEIRGRGWHGVRRKGDHKGTDKVRVCKMGSIQGARRVAECVAEMVYED